MQPRGWSNWMPPGPSRRPAAIWRREIDADPAQHPGRVSAVAAIRLAPPKAGLGPGNARVDPARDSCRSVVAPTARRSGCGRRLDPIDVRNLVIAGRGRDRHEVLCLGTFGSGPHSGRSSAMPVSPNCCGIAGRPADRGPGTAGVRDV